MRGLYPPIEPYECGVLAVGEGNRLYWEACGNPAGRPVLVLHGGPGSGCAAGMRRGFDPERYRIVLFDQRGCGRSTPHAGDPATDLSANTTWHLLADIEALREHLGIEAWLVYGGSWGCTLGLLYAERCTPRVTGLVLVGVTLTRRSEIEWLYRGVGPRLPDAFARFRAGAPEAGREGDLVEAYHRRLHDPDPALRAKAAQDFHDWEAALLSADPEARPPPEWSDPRFRMARARIVTHYFRNAAWLEDAALLHDAGALRDVRGVMIQGREDLQAPLSTARELAAAWPGGELVIVEKAGHSSGDRGMAEAIVAATDRFAAGAAGA